MAESAGSAALVLVEGVQPIRPEPALFESMLEGWKVQQNSRRLGASIIGGRERVVRRFQSYTAMWPWRWTAEQLEAWMAQGRWAHSTTRSGSTDHFLDAGSVGA